MDYYFRKATINEVKHIFDLIQKRMHWMDKVGIKQWNVTEYDKIYPIEYYMKEQSKGTLFVLEEKKTNNIVAAAVLLEEDDRWNDGASSFYLHNFVTDIDAKGVGKIFLAKAEEYATIKGKKYFRLDSAESNKKLEQYYTFQKFEAVGRCIDAQYIGILRQKELSKKTMINGFFR